MGVISELPIPPANGTGADRPKDSCTTIHPSQHHERLICMRRCYCLFLALSLVACGSSIIEAPKSNSDNSEIETSIQDSNQEQESPKSSFSSPNDINSSSSQASDARLGRYTVIKNYSSDSYYGGPIVTCVKPCPLPPASSIEVWSFSQINTGLFVQTPITTLSSVKTAQNANSLTSIINDPYGLVAININFGKNIFNASGTLQLQPITCQLDYGNGPADIKLPCAFSINYSGSQVP